MRDALWFAVLAVFCAPLQAQHPFYVQLYEDGDRAMQTGEWSTAARYLEIAAFGLLDDPAMLQEIYPRLTLSLHRAEQPEKMREALLKMERVLPNLQQKPPTLALEAWEQVLVLAGRREPPGPALPNEYDELLQLVREEPEREDAWVALVEKAMATRGISRVRRHLDRGLKALPESRKLLELGLLFAVTRDGERGAEKLASQLAALEARHPLANEYLAKIAFDRGDRDRAAAHLRHVGEPRLPGTEALSRELTSTDREQEQPDEPDNAVPEETERPTQTTVEPEARRDTKPPVQVTPDTKESSPATALSDSETDSGTGTTKAEDRHPSEDPNDARYRDFERYLEAKRWRKARRVLNALSETDANSTRYAESWAGYSYLRGNYEELVAKLRPRQTLTAKMNFYLGMAHWKLGQLNQAERAFASLSRTTFPDLRDFDQQVGPQLASQRTGAANGNQETRCMTMVLDALAADQTAEAERMFTLCAEQMDILERDYLTARIQLAKGEYAGAKQGFMDLAKAKFLEYDLFFWAGKAALGAQDRVLAQYFLDKAAETSTAYEQEIRELRSRLQ